MKKEKYEIENDPVIQMYDKAIAEGEKRIKKHNRGIASLVLLSIAALASLPFVAKRAEAYSNAKVTNPIPKIQRTIPKARPTEPRRISKPAKLETEVQTPESEIQKETKETAYQISKEGIDLIKEYESFRSKAYKCQAGKWTIGYGTTKGVKNGDTITEVEAENRFTEDLSYFEEVVNESVKVDDLTQYQYNALVSFAYNVGAGDFKRSTLLKKLNRGDYDGASKEFDRWIYANKSKSNGLVNRRNAEAKMFRR